MKLRVIGPPIVARRCEPKKRYKLYPCSDMVLRDQTGIAKEAGVSLPTIMRRLKDSGPYDSSLFDPKQKAGRKGSGGPPRKKWGRRPGKGETDHEKAINAHIREAERYADRTAGNDIEWNRLYCRKMNELTRAAGLRV